MYGRNFSFHISVIIQEQPIRLSNLRTKHISHHTWGDCILQNTVEVDKWILEQQSTNYRHWNKSHPYACKLRHTLIHQPVVRKLYVKGKLQGLMLLSNFCTPYSKYQVKKSCVKQNEFIYVIPTYYLFCIERKFAILCYRRMYNSYTLASKLFLYTFW